jgi:hypothetical protein
MHTESETRSLATSSKLQGIAKTIRLTGWIGFWGQLAFTVVATLALLFASTGRRFSDQPNPGLGVGIFWAVMGILVLLFSLYWNFRYTRMGRKLANSNPSLPKSEPKPLASSYGDVGD